MGIAAVMRLARNMPRKITAAAIYGSQVYGADEGHEAMPAPSITTSDYKILMTRMAEMEEKLNVLCSRPQVMPPEKEELLNATISRADTLEQELAAAKKVSI